MTGTREEALRAAANALLDARRTGHLLTDLPEDIRPTDTAEIYAVQDTVAAAFGDIGGWKIGAPTPEATPLSAPMPLNWIVPGESVLSGAQWRFRGLEAEVAFLVGQDIPPRGAAYGREEVLNAMEYCCPAIEVLETAFEDPAKASREAVLADLQMHGGFVHGPALAGWRSVDFTKEKVTLAVDGVVRVERTGSNTAGDLLRLLPWLANEGSARTGGLRKGQWITTGSWTGNTLAGPGSVVDVSFATLGKLSVRFA